jgi:hypothetical protein
MKNIFTAEKKGIDGLLGISSLWKDGKIQENYDS